VQVAVPSRTDVKEYQELKEDIDKLVGSINGSFSTPSWSPIRFTNAPSTSLPSFNYYCCPDLIGFIKDYSDNRIRKGDMLP
jgi:trehalose-6-phosphate synthase